MTTKQYVGNITLAWSTSKSSSAVVMITALGWDNDLATKLGPPKSFDNQARLPRSWWCTLSTLIFTKFYPHKSPKCWDKIIWRACGLQEHVRSREITRDKFENNPRMYSKNGIIWIWQYIRMNSLTKVRELLFETFRDWNHAKSREVTRGNGSEMATSHRWIYGVHNVELHFSIKSLC